MNTLDVQEVLDALDEIVEQKLHDQAQLERLQASIQKIIHLDSLQGEGAKQSKTILRRSISLYWRRSSFSSANTSNN
nr:LXG domain-containing protein [Shouchella tritolerans]